MTKFTIEYDLDNHGWARVKFTNAQGQCESLVSYLHDSLGQLADMGLELKRGLSDAKAIFMDEPGELQFIVEKRDSEAYYELRQFKDWASWGMHSESDYTLLLKGRCPMNRIIQQISTNLWRIYEEIGVEEYQTRWIEHPFPIEKYNALIGS